MTSTFFPSLENFHKSFDPFTVGFDDILKQLEDIQKTSTLNAGSFPPYNIKQVKENKYVIEMAVAGFAKTDIEVTLEGNKLVIKGNSEDDKDSNYLYKGIAGRKFNRVFTLADKIEISDVEMVNGMLKVWLENMVKAQDLVKKLTIK
jgi:molecular chaperone IbpA